ncbi:GGDEF domain-containing protein [Marinobacter zhejiangensis]|uniref:GGDEF domain-containing protein n=1 Tax=Marinobacter zhejiangensis TaxID=488535 RepID=UPI0015875AC0|nr:GGDEF domain-containing protein [Marinobacter zhejiangensis]
MITAAAFSMVLIGAAQTWVQYRSEVIRVNELVDVLAQTHVPVLTMALWDIEPTVAETQVSTIASHREIEGAYLSTATGMMFQAGVVDTEVEPEFTVAIPNPRNNSEAPLGELRVYYDHGEIQQAILLAVAGGTLKLGLFIVLVCLVVYRVMFYRLKAPLRQIADYSKELLPDRDNPPLVIQRPERQWQDEIDLVAEGFETLREAISRYSRERDRAMKELAEERDQLEIRVAERTKELESSRRELYLLSHTDHLTGLANRRSFEDRSRLEERRVRRYPTPLSLVMIDVDYFKGYNDFYGHAKGDECLVALGKVMMDHCRRAGEFAVRMGGEEFALLLAGQDAEGAAEVAERLRQALFDANILHEGSPLGRVTISLGCASWEPGGDLPLDDALIDRMLSLADKRLYKAKFNGRNRVCSSGATELDNGSVA